MSNIDNIEERVKKTVCEHLGTKAEEFTNDASFSVDLGADSLDTVELVMAFEEEFLIDLADEIASEITTVQEAINTIREQIIVQGAEDATQEAQATGAIPHPDQAAS